MATLAGYSTPAQFNKNWDHTYVESDNGYSWECFGSNGGGTHLCSGIGDSFFADCLSHPRFFTFGGKRTVPGITKYAGITYATTGVCHQAANRILYPAGVIVASARGYGLSVFLYGTYGNEAVPWPQLIQCAKTPPGRSSSQGASTVAHGSSQSIQLASKIRDIYGRASATSWEQDQEFTLAKEELQALFDVRLGKGYDRSKLENVTSLQVALRQQKRELVARMQRGELDPDQFAEKLRHSLTDTALRCEAILGPKDFVQLFGVEARHAADMIDPPTR